MRRNGLRERFSAHPWLKGVGCTAAIGTFMVAYFFVMRNPVFPVTTMPILAPDRWIRLVPLSVWVYFSLWVYICLPPALMRTRRELASYFLGAFVLSVVGLLVFILAPTAVPQWDIDWSAYPWLEFLKDSDAAGNACPSLHVGFSVFSGLWMGRILRLLQAGVFWRIVSGMWWMAIALSTMTTRQHVFVDVACGAILGAAVYRANAWWVSRSRQI